jgi:hypothetical protein
LLNLVSKRLKEGLSKDILGFPALGPTEDEVSRVEVLAHSRDLVFDIAVPHFSLGSDSLRTRPGFSCLQDRNAHLAYTCEQGIHVIATDGQQEIGVDYVQEVQGKASFLSQQDCMTDSGFAPDAASNGTDDFAHLPNNHFLFRFFSPSKRRTRLRSALDTGRSFL